MSPPQTGLIVPPRVRRHIQDSWQDYTGPLVLSNASNNGHASITLDYGRCEGGFPVYEIQEAKGTGPISLRVVFSETIDGIDAETGDGPFFLFSNAMDSYRNVSYTVEPSAEPQTLEPIHSQRSQRYQKLVLASENASITFCKVGFRRIRDPIVPKARFHCSNETLNRIWNDGVTTLDMCTIAKEETEPAWQVTEEGTRVFGQHWAPCRQGTRWGDKTVSFQVLVERGGASWGIHIVVNGLIFCLDPETKILSAFEGLADKPSIFPSTPKGIWRLVGDVGPGKWIDVSMRASSASVTISINGFEVGSVEDLAIRPILGGDINSGSVALGGPEGWVALYRNLVVKGVDDTSLYENDMLTGSQDRTLADFQVGTNSVACTIDGAKRDRACFGGDLFVSGRAIAYSGMDLTAVAGTIELLTSHQMPDGYLGSLCPAQAPLHSGEDLPPTYAFYSLTYALLLVVSIKDYWMHSGDEDLVKACFPKIQRLLEFVEAHIGPDGLVEAPPRLSMHWFPMGGPVFGVSGTINLAYYDALNAMQKMSADEEFKTQLKTRAESLQNNLSTALLDSKTGIFRMSKNTPGDGLCQDTNAYAITLGISPEHDNDPVNLVCNEKDLPVAFKNLGHWDAAKVVSPYATGFAIEAMFKRNLGKSAVKLTERVWGVMADSTNANYSGGHWEAMKTDGTPFGHGTSLMHAWSTWPVFLLPQYLAGLTVLEPGWSRFKIEPVLSGVDSIRYDIETPLGLLAVDLNVDDVEGTGTIKLEMPAGSTAEVAPPSGYILDGPSVIVADSPLISSVHFSRNTNAAIPESDSTWNGVDMVLKSDSSDETKPTVEALEN